MEKGHTIGIIMRSMMENGKMVGSMDLEFGKALRATHMLENGKITKLVEKDCISGKTGINMKENGKKV
jgi:hypothetical protein